MSAFTLTYNKNVETRKMLIGIANFIKHNSEAKAISQGSNILTTDQEIRKTKKAQVLLPLLNEIVDVKDLLSQAKSGGVELTEADLNEFIVDLANEKATKPQMFRPRDGEVITESTADALVPRYQSGYEITATVAKDRAFYASVVKGIKDGVGIAVGNAGLLLKGKITDATPVGATEKERDEHISRLLIADRNSIKKTRDRLVQGKIANKDIIFVINTDTETAIENNAAYNLYTKEAQEKNGMNLSIDANYRGSDVIVSKQMPKDVPYLIFFKGSATSIFSIRKYLNFDKVRGVQAYASSMEFDEGTGVWLPQMIVMGTTNVATYPVQDAITFDDLILDMNVSQTNAGNAGNEAGIPDGNAGYIPTLDEVNKMTDAVIQFFAKVQKIDLSGAADAAARKAEVIKQLGLA